MPDEEGKTTATEETSTPLHAYKDGREEDVKEGDLGANPDQEDMPAGSDQPSQYHDGEPPSGDEGDVEREPAGPGGDPTRSAG